VCLLCGLALFPQASFSVTEIQIFLEKMKLKQQWVKMGYQFFLSRVPDIDRLFTPAIILQNRQTLSEFCTVFGV
jgi:hypothetical protein